MPAIRDARAALLLLALLASCSGGSSDSVPADPEPAVDVLLRGDDPPGIAVEILAVEGGSGSGGFFRAGDRPSVRFTVTKDDGSAWGLGEFDAGRILVSGPSFNYQRVIAAQDDVVARAQKLGDGSYRYTFADALPAAYLAPYNDSPTFGAGDGELAGQALLDGTYTVGLALGWDYTFEGQGRRDSGEDAAPFLFGGSATLVEREVVTTANCNACHGELTAHGGLHRDLRVCVLCHTQGAQDLSGPTPGVSVSSRVLFHRIHTGRYLPSVVGVTTKPNGQRDYTPTGTPFVVTGADGPRDYSNVGFPAWPNRAIPMPRDFGYNALNAAAKAKEDLVRRGPTDCALCHGDPDGAGPLVEPAQGETILAEPSRAACGACHDDWVWDRPYDAGNGQVMPPQPNDAICRECHVVDDDLVPSFSIRGGHEHPLLNRQHNPFLGQGIHLAIPAAAPIGDGDAFLEAGERIGLVLELTEDDGSAVNPGSVGGLHAVLSGPAGNPNLVHEVEIPRVLLTGTSPFTLNVPERRELESLGVSTSAPGEVFHTARHPVHTIPGQPTRVFVHGPALVLTTLAADSSPPDNALVVADATGIARDDVLVVEPGDPDSQEFLRVQLVEGNTLRLSSPHAPTYPSSTRLAHAAGATVAVVALTELTTGVDYDLDTATGTLTELVELGDVGLAASYTGDFVLPRRYPIAANGSPEVGAAAGAWEGLELVDGAYTLAVTATRDFDYFAPGAITRYRAVSPAATVTLPVGAGPTPVPRPPVESGNACLACHRELYFHTAGWRGFDACIACHGNAGIEDRPQYVSANAPATPGVRTEFRALLHQIHMGRALPDASSHLVVGEGSAPWPDDFTARSFEHVGFPRSPGRAAQCTVCHGAGEGWKEPVPREHPDGQAAPTQAWRPVCTACHVTDSAIAHVDVNTAPSGSESCATCHGIGREWNVELYHRVR